MGKREQTCFIRWIFELVKLVVLVTWRLWSFLSRIDIEEFLIMYR